MHGTLVTSMFISSKSLKGNHATSLKRQRLMNNPSYAFEHLETKLIKGKVVDFSGLKV